MSKARDELAEAYRAYHNLKFPVSLQGYVAAAKRLEIAIDAVLAEPDPDLLKAERDELAKWFSEKHELTQRLRRDLTERCEQLTGMTAERDRLTGQVQQRDAEIERLQKLSEARGRRICELDGAITRLTRMIDDKDASMGRAIAEGDKLAAENAELRKQKNLLKWAVDSNRIAVTDADGTVTASYSYDDVQRTNRDNWRLRAERDQMAEDLKACGAALAAANQELAALREAAATISDMRGQLGPSEADKRAMRDAKAEVLRRLADTVCWDTVLSFVQP